MSERLRGIDGIRAWEIEQRREKRREQDRRDGKCACGNPIDECSPERCSHPFAHNARGLGDGA